MVHSLSSIDRTTILLPRANTEDSHAGELFIGMIFCMRSGTTTPRIISEVVARYPIITSISAISTPSDQKGKTKSCQSYRCLSAHEFYEHHLARHQQPHQRSFSVLSAESLRRSDQTFLPLGLWR